MAEIRVNIKGDDSDIKAKFKETSAAAREFSEHVKEQFGQLKEMSADIAGEAGFGLLKKALTGLGGVSFGVLLVDQFKKASAAAVDWEKQVTALKFSLPAAFSGMAGGIYDWVESVSGGMGSLQENLGVMRALLQSGMGLDEAKAALIDIQNAAAKTSYNVADLGKAFAEIRETGRMPERFWREFPAIAPIARGLGGGEAPSADWMLRTLLPAISPGGMTSLVRTQVGQTAAAQLADFGVEMEKVTQTLGVELLPTMKEWLSEFKKAIPEMGATAKELGEDLRIAFGWIHKNMGWLFSDIAANRYPGQRTVEAAHSMLFGTAPPDMAMHASLFNDAATNLRRAAEKHEAVADKLNRAVNPH
jgi:hypothetical protein